MGLTVAILLSPGVLVRILEDTLGKGFVTTELYKPEGFSFLFEKDCTLSPAFFLKTSAPHSCSFLPLLALSGSDIIVLVTQKLCYSVFSQGSLTTEKKKTTKTFFEKWVSRFFCFLFFLVKINWKKTKG